MLTLFPEMFPGPLGVSLLGKALANALWSLEVRDIREHGLGKHRTVDDTPAGGGPGMVMRADVAAAAIDAARATGPERPAIYLSPRGTPPYPGPRPGPGGRPRRRSCSAAGSRGWTSGPSRRAAWRRSPSAISCWRGRDRGHGPDRGRRPADPRRSGRPKPRPPRKVSRPGFWNIPNSPGPRASRAGTSLRF